MKRALSWVAGFASTLGGGAALADAPALPLTTHLKESEQSRAMRTMGRLFETYVRNDIGIPDTMQHSGKNYGALEERITDKDKVHELGRRFELDGDELNRATEVLVTGSAVPGQKHYVFFVEKGGHREVYANGVTSEMKDGDRSGTYWSLALYHKNSMRFGWEPDNNPDQKKIKRITWVERPVSETGEPLRPHFVMQLRARSTDWGWERQGIYDQKYVEELLGKQKEGAKRISGR